MVDGLNIKLFSNQAVLIKLLFLYFSQSLIFVHVLVQAGFLDIFFSWVWTHRDQIIVKGSDYFHERHRFGKHSDPLDHFFIELDDSIAVIKIV